MRGDREPQFKGQSEELVVCGVVVARSGSRCKSRGEQSAPWLVKSQPWPAANGVAAVVTHERGERRREKGREGERKRRQGENESEG
eukprot:scaffold205403_cov40-Tisochrysis_lutea.AAC.2